MDSLKAQTTEQMMGSDGELDGSDDGADDGLSEGEL